MEAPLCATWVDVGPFEGPQDGSRPRTQNGSQGDFQTESGAVTGLSEARGRCAEVGPYSLALFRLGDEAFALENGCPHRGGPLCEGDVKDGIVYCPLHAWGFDLRTGAGTTVRRSRARTFQAKVVDGRVWVALPGPPPPGPAGENVDPEPEVA